MEYPFRVGDMFIYTHGNNGTNEEFIVTERGCLSLIDNFYWKYPVNGQGQGSISSYTHSKPKIYLGGE